MKTNQVITIETLNNFRKMAIAFNCGFPNIFISDDRPRYNGKSKPLMTVILPERKTYETEKFYSTKTTFVEINENGKIATFGTAGTSGGKITKKTVLEREWKLEEAINYIDEIFEKYKKFAFFKGIKIEKTNINDFDFYAGCYRNKSF